MFDRPLALRTEGDVLVVQGSVDEYSLGELRERLVTLVDDLAARQRVCVDLCGVDYLPSAGVGLLVRAVSRARDREAELVLLASEGCPAQQVLALTGIPYTTP